MLTVFLIMQDKIEQNPKIFHLSTGSFSFPGGGIEKKTFFPFDFSSLILHSTTEIQAPIDEVTCSDGCYKDCNEMTQNEDLINKGWYFKSIDFFMEHN